MSVDPAHEEGDTYYFFKIITLINSVVMINEDPLNSRDSKDKNTTHVGWSLSHCYICAHLTRQ